MATTKVMAVRESRIVSKIYLIRSKRVMPDFDLAEMYTVETKQLKRQVKRNLDRFPSDFMFTITAKEYESLRSQIGTLKRGQHSKYLPLAFTEQGVAMLSSVLNSKTAIHVNIKIIRVFTRMREILLRHKNILLKLEQLEKKVIQQDGKLEKQSEDIETIFEALKRLLNPPARPRPKISFRRSNEAD